MLLLPLLAACDQNDAGMGASSLEHHESSAAELQTFSACTDLEAAIKESVGEQMRVRLLQLLDEDYYARWYWGWPMLEDAAFDDAAAGAPATADSDARQEGVDFSGTNNQETGVDEADISKTDGYYIYTLNGQRLEILGIPEFGELTHVGTASIEGSPSQILVGNEKAVVFSTVYPYGLPADDALRVATAQDEKAGFWRSSSLTKVTVLDLADRAAPTVAREIYIEGSYQTARMVSPSVRMVSYAYMEIPGLQYWPILDETYYQLDPSSSEARAALQRAVLATIDANEALIADTTLADLIPQIYERRGEGIVIHPFADADCAHFQSATDALSHGVTSIISLDLLGETFAFDADHIISNWPTVYASTRTLLIAEPSQDFWWYWDNSAGDEQTNIHRFDIQQAGTTTYTGSGRVAGTVTDQFSLSEDNAIVRVAATTGQWNRWWLPDPEPSVTHVYILEGDGGLEQVGEVGGIAPEERLWSARFVGDRAYLVTFRNIDPLWVVDLSDKSAPRIIGELEVPGVSTYLHPLDSDHLLTIGFGGDDDTGLDWGRVQVSLFDLSDPTQPVLQDKLALAPTPTGDGWSNAWSEATYEHKAFSYWEPLGLLAIPLSSWRYSGDGFAFSYEYSTRLQLITVDRDAGLSAYGEIDHSSFFNDKASCWWNWRDIRRSYFMGNYVYALSDRAVTAHDLDTMGLVVGVPLPGDFEQQTCY